MRATSGLDSRLENLLSLCWRCVLSGQDASVCCMCTEHLLRASRVLELGYENNSLLSARNTTCSEDKQAG